MLGANHGLERELITIYHYSSIFFDLHRRRRRRRRRLLFRFILLFRLRGCRRHHCRRGCRRHRS